MSAYVRKIIRDKREWHSQVTPEEEALGFKGWHSRGYLPHFDSPGLRQFITYRLADALPASRRHEWQALLEIEDDFERIQKLEAYIDLGHGECHLRDPQIAAVVQENLLHFDGKTYRLIAWCIMPNHVHALIEMKETPLDEVLGSWKSYTSKRANRLLGRTGQFWQEEYFDRYMRDEEHLRQVLHYIENNPVNARLVRAPEQWRWGSARYRAEQSEGGLPWSAGGPPASTNEDTTHTKPNPPAS